jgi:chaperone required for assembly of F1-ATPase
MNKPGEPARGLPKRFYTSVTVAAVDSPPHHAEGVSSERRGEGLGVGGSPTTNGLRSPPPYPSPTRGEGKARLFRVLLDGKPIRTPAKAELAVPTEPLAQAIAEEWRAQGTHIDPSSMPLTRLANSAIDGVARREAEVRADIAKYAGSDLLCYRAEGPEVLQRRQAEVWDPILRWAEQDLGARFTINTGLMPVAQPDAATAAVARALEDYEGFALAALHVITTLTGSVLLALALARGRLTAEQAWAAAHVDEDWQISQWGEDAEAKARRERRWADMQAASRMLGLVGAEPAR